MPEQNPGRSRPLSLPQRVDLPFFTYGALKPGEPAHSQIKNFLHDAPTPATIRGALWVRDGLPLLQVCDFGYVPGFLLCFGPERAESAYRTICEFEPRNHYCWQECVLKEPDVCANVLIGKKLENGRASHLEANSWTVRDDPVFCFGLKVVHAAIDTDAYLPFDSAPPDSFDWSRFFRLQMAYLLVWSGIERYTALLLGPAMDPWQRIKRFGEHELFQSAFHRAGVTRRRQVCDSRNPENTYVLDPANSKSAIGYYYQVRSNLSHRGKGAWTDGEIVRESLVELTRVFEEVLSMGAEGGHSAQQDRSSVTSHTPRVR